ncbi:MAG: hypothetical protein U1F41_10805 [Burkholderiales bacterium]
MSARRTAAWPALAFLAIGVASALRLHALGAQVVIDDEWHALHKVMRSSVADILTHLDYADYSIPVALYYRALQVTAGITEWSMRAPMLLCGLLLVALAPWLARSWTSRPVGVAWSVLLAISPMLVYLSRTARPYAITAFTSTVAIVAFERWWRGERHRGAWAAAYVIATFAGGWLHMLSLAFTLTPFLYFGARSLRDRAAFARIFKMGLVTALPLAIAILPPLVNDWSMFSAKAGQDSVTLDTLERTLLMVSGTGQAIVGGAFALLVALGFARWWARDRVLAGYALALIAIGSVAIAMARPNWVQYALVYARYLVPVVPLLLLLAAEGLVAALPLRGEVLRACAVAGIAAGLVAAGPLPRLWYTPNQFTSHQRFQFDYDDARSPYVTQRIEGVPAFYRELARAPAGSLTVVVAPWRLESHFNPHVWYQETHRQNVKIGILTPLCGKRDFGEYPEGTRGVNLRNMVHVEALLRGQTRGADFLVIHRRPWSTPPGQDVPWPDLAQCLPAIERALGAPVYQDDEIVAFALRR